MKTPRKTKKAIQKAIISYDVAAFPKGLRDMETLIRVFKETGFVLYEGDTGQQPRFLGRKNKRVNVKKYTNE